MALLTELRAEISSSRPDDHQTDDLLSWLNSCFSVCENDPSYCLYSKSQAGRREGGGRDFSGSSLSQFNYEFLPVISGPLLVHGPEFKDTRNREFCDIAVTSFKQAHCIEIVTRSNRVISLANLSSIVSLPIIEKQRSKHGVGSFSPTLTSLQIHSPRDEFVVISAIELQSNEDERTVEEDAKRSALSDLKNNPYFLQHSKAPSILMLISLPDVFSLDLVFLQSVNDLIERNGGISKNKRHKDNNGDDDNDKDDVSKFTIEVGTNPFRNHAVNTTQVLIVSSTVFSAVLIEFNTMGKDVGFVTIRSGFTSQELLESLKSGTSDPHEEEEDNRLDKNHAGVVSSTGATFDEEIEKKRVLRAYFERRGALLPFNDNKALLTSASTEEDVALAIIEEATVIRAAQATHFPLTPSMDSFLKTVEEMKDLNVRIAASKEKAGDIETRLVKLISAQLCQLKDVEAALYALRLRKMETRDKNL